MPPLSTAKTHADFPQSFGSRPVSMFDHKGPSSYTQISIATPPTGGDPVVPQEAGLKSFGGITAMGLSTTGRYYAYAVQLAAGAWALLWITADGGAQVGGATDLSAETITLFAIGR